LHKGGNGTSLAVLFHREPERVCSFRLKCSANVAPGWHRPPPPAIDTESQHGHLHYVTVFEAQSSVVGAQGIEPSVLVLVAQAPPPSGWVSRLLSMPWPRPGQRLYQRRPELLPQCHAFVVLTPGRTRRGPTAISFVPVAGSRGPSAASATSTPAVYPNRQSASD
jgi:hypothetical protein